MGILGIYLSGPYIAIISYSILILSIFSCSLFFDIFLQKHLNQKFNGRVGSLIRLCSQIGTVVSLSILPILNKINSSSVVFIFSLLVIGLTLIITFFIKNDKTQIPKKCNERK